MEDLALAEMDVSGHRMTEANYFRNSETNLSSSIISDVTKEMGKSFMLDPSLRQVSGGKICGRDSHSETRCARKGDERNIHVSDAWEGHL